MSERTLLMSIRPEFARRIFEGKKKVELRRTRPQVHCGDQVLVYVSSPVKALMGYFEVQHVIGGEPRWLWTEVRRGAGVTADQFHAYYAGASLAVAIFLAKAKRFNRPLTLDALRQHLGRFAPPQSYYYLASETAERIMALGGGPAPAVA